jgi:hypothetical protein
MFTNKVPHFDVPMYSIHMDRGVYTVFPSMTAVAADLSNLDTPPTLDAVM